MGGAGSGPGAGAFTEYRYDALGRRIAVRSRFDTSQCSQARPEPCKSRVTRTVWDGDQLLLELRATGDENTDSHTEWVAYTQGPGIDAPLMVRARKGLTYDIVPLANRRGSYEAGVFPDGRTVMDGLDLTKVSWPAAGYTAYFDYIPDQDDKEPVWLGSLMSHKRDASGQLYMRNRYYDPQSGRFTQEDPIGLAGGLNLYGFGGGDPVNYSDPYGLKVKPIGAEAERYWNGLLAMVQTGLASQDQAQKAAANVLNMMIQDLQSDRRTLNIISGEMSGTMRDQNAGGYTRLLAEISAGGVRETTGGTTYLDPGSPTLPEGVSMEMVLGHEIGHAWFAFTDPVTNRTTEQRNKMSNAMADAAESAARTLGGCAPSRAHASGGAQACK